MTSETRFAILFGAGASAADLLAKPAPPPLGRNLIGELVRFHPETWGTLPSVLIDALTEDFEAGMARLLESDIFREKATILRVGDTRDRESPVTIPELLRVMAAYFLFFHPSYNCLYTRLIRRTLDWKWKGAFCTLNYERMLDLSVQLCALTACQGPAKSEFQREVIYPHGACNFFAAGNHAPGAVLTYPGFAHRGEVAHVADGAAAYARVQVDGFPPAMSFYAHSKDTICGQSFIRSQRSRWAEVVRDATSIAIIGARVAAHDKHIWEPLAKAPGRLIYCGGSGHGRFREWASAERPGNGDVVFEGRWENHFDEICNHIGLSEDDRCPPREWRTRSGEVVDDQTV